MTDTTLNEGMMRCDVLTIDAWADGEGGWQWNQWYKHGDPVDLPREADADAVLAQGAELGFYDAGSIDKLDVEDDDGRNLVIVVKETREPWIAFDYGAHWEVNGL